MVRTVLEGVGLLDDELNGADAVARSDGAAGDDGEVGSKGGDGDQAKVGAVGQEFIGAERRLGGVEGIALCQRCGKRRVLEVPHERRGVEEVDGGNAKHGG